VRERQEEVEARQARKARAEALYYADRRYVAEA
jgi:hypothetical protein